MVFNRYAAGAKIYGGGRSNPTSGPVDPMGYKERDLRKKRRLVAQRRLKARLQGKHASADAKRGPVNG